MKLILDSENVRALAWTLVHSLWIATAFAIVAWVLLRFAVSRAKSALRYNALSFLLYGFIASVALTALLEFSSAEVPDAANLRSVIYADALSTAPSTDFTVSMAGPFGFVDTYAIYLTGLWLLICIFKIAKYVLALRYIKRLRYTGTIALPEEWQHTIKQLATRLGIRRNVMLVKSEKLKIPAVIGYLRPLVILPAGLLTQLPADQIEAILLHELSHIRRKDYLVNLLHCLIESVFFFNPAIMWLLSLIREERENACDDIVLKSGSDKVTYMKALLSFESATPLFHRPELTLGLRGGQLVRRIKRIAGVRTSYFSMREIAAVLVGGILSASSFLVGNESVARPSSNLFEGHTEATHTQTPLSTPELSIIKARSCAEPLVLRVDPVAENSEDVIPASNEAILPTTDAERVRGMLDALVEAGVVSDKSAIKWFGLTDDQLVVNGISQSDQLHRKLKERFKIIPDYGLFYGPVEIYGKGFFVDEQELAAL